MASVDMFENLNILACSIEGEGGRGRSLSLRGHALYAVLSALQKKLDFVLRYHGCHLCSLH